MWGPVMPRSYDGKDYFISFTDDYSQWSQVEPMTHKSNTFVHYQAYKAWLQTQHGAKLKKLQIDCGGEYLSEEFTTHLRTCSTICNLTIHDTPEENGVSERLNYMLLEHAHAMLLTSGLLKFLWMETIEHATWIKNCMGTHALDGKTPYEMVFKS